MSAARKPLGRGVRPAIAKVKMAAKELGLDDETYRAILLRLTGKTSSTECTDAQLGLVLDEFKAKGWVAKKPAKHVAKSATCAKPADTAVAKKARALWLSLYQLGVVREPGEPALEAFAKRQVGVDRLQWMGASQAYSLIEALKKMAERAGWRQGVQTPHEVAALGSIDHTALLRCRLIQAQHARLVALGVFRPLGEAGLTAWIESENIVTSRRALSAMTDVEIDTTIGRLAAIIRRRQPANAGG